MDQASTLRMMARRANAATPMQIYAITSGKGGVGKTSIVCNLATCFGLLGKRVLLVDADLGLANVDILLGLKPKATLAHVFRGECALGDILIDGPHNVTVLPSGSGVRELTQLTDGQILEFMSGLDELEHSFDVMLVDTGAGIGKNVLYFNAAAQDVIVVATPEPTSLTDAYAIMKVLSRDHGVKRFNLVVNSVVSPKAALRVFRQLTAVSDEYLDIHIDYLGHVLRDEEVSRAVLARSPLVVQKPASPAAVCIAELAQRLVEEQSVRGPTGNMQFFWKRLLQASA